MKDGDRLLRAILEDPSDDASRLVYADWLEEQGQGERAEFIQAQVGLARIRKMAGREPGYDPERHFALHRAEGKYDYETGVWWCELFPRGKAPWGVERIWRRGFIEEVRCPLQAWLDNARAICARHPVERVKPGDKRPSPSIMGTGNMRWFPDYWHGPSDGPDDRSPMEKVSLLPQEIFDLLPPDGSPEDPLLPGDEWDARSSAYYPSVAEADDALSFACAAFGRRAAGLPPLPERSRT